MIGVYVKNGFLGIRVDDGPVIVVYYFILTVNVILYIHILINKLDSMVL